jgi:hypothetical protein
MGLVVSIEFLQDAEFLPGNSASWLSSESFDQSAASVYTTVNVGPSQFEVGLSQFERKEGVVLSTQVLLDVPDELYSRVKSVAARTHRAVTDILLDSITDSFAPFPADPRRAEMSRNGDAFTALHPKLVEAYLGETVAICDGRLVDHDADPVALLQRIRRDFPNQVVLRRKVETAPERELRIRHPRITPAL